jgi:hypothetical protein
MDDLFERSSDLSLLEAWMGFSRMGGVRFATLRTHSFSRGNCSCRFSGCSACAPLPAPSGLGKRTEIRLLEPRYARLSGEQRREAVALLADLLLDAAQKAAGVSGGVSAGVMGGASGSVVAFPERRGKARRCA